MLLQVVPREHLQELVEVLVDVLHRELAFVDRIQPAFEERFGHLQTGFLHQIVAQLEREEVVAFAAQLRLDARVDELVQSGLVLHLATGECRLEELLVQLRFGELADLGDFEREFGFDALQLVLLDLQHGGALRRVLVEFVDIDFGLEAHLLADERLALLLRHRDQAHVSVRHVHLAVVERDRQRLVRSHLVGIDQTAVLTQVVGAVVVVHLLVHLDLAVGQLILVRKFEFYLRSLADFEHEFELLAVLEIEIALLFRRNHVAQVVDVLLLEILEHRVRGGAVGLLGQHALAVHLLDETHGHHAGPETRNIGLAPVFAQLFLDGLAVILFAHRYLEQRIVLFALFSYDLHNECFLYCYCLISEIGSQR